jgi:hypothetical protein
MDDFVLVDLCNSIHDLPEDFEVVNSVNDTTVLNEAISSALVSLLDVKLQSLARAVFHLNHHVHGKELFLTFKKLV